MTFVEVFAGHKAQKQCAHSRKSGPENGVSGCRDPWSHWLHLGVQRKPRDEEHNLVTKRVSAVDSVDALNFKNTVKQL